MFYGNDFLPHQLKDQIHFPMQPQQKYKEEHLLLYHSTAYKLIPNQTVLSHDFDKQAYNELAICYSRSG